MFSWLNVSSLSIVFLTNNALGAHQFHFQEKKAWDPKIELSTHLEEKGCILTQVGCPKEHVKISAIEKDNRDEPELNMINNKKQKVAKFDGRKDNHGSASRARIDSREKVVYVDEINAYLDSHENVTLNKYLLNVK